MKYSKILMCLTVLVCLAVQACAQSDPLGGSPSGTDQARNEMVGWLNQPIGENSSGQVRDRSMVNEGIASMLQWLDTPVPNIPLYTMGGAIYNQAVPDTTFSPFTQYYVTSGSPVMGGIISNPTMFDIKQKTPTAVYFGAGVGLPYTQYEATVTSKTNDLWIQGATNWTQYVVCPVGTWLQLIAYAPVAGPVGFYETIQTNTTSTKYKTYQLNQGYNTMNFNADQVGRHMLYFVVNNQPSNTVIVDVFTQSGSTSPVHTMS